MRSARAHALGVGGQIDLGRDAGFARGALEGLGGRAQIARAVVDDGDAHRQRRPDSRTGRAPDRLARGPARRIGAAGRRQARRAGRLVRAVRRGIADLGVGDDCRRRRRPTRASRAAAARRPAAPALEPDIERHQQRQRRRRQAQTQRCSPSAPAQMPAQAPAPPRSRAGATAARAAARGRPSKRKAVADETRAVGRVRVRAAGGSMTT